MLPELIKISKYKCNRCGCVNEVINRQDKIDTPLINHITLDGLNYKGNLIGELSGINYYICNDCWNELLDFFHNEDD